MTGKQRDDMIKVIDTETNFPRASVIEDFTEEVLAKYFSADLDQIRKNRETGFMDNAENIEIGTIHGKRIASYFDYDGEVSFIIEV